MMNNMMHRNDGRQTLSFGYFQGYSNIKRSLRHSPADLLANKGFATAALTMPKTDAVATTRLRDKRDRLLRLIRGQMTPEDPEASIPFAREGRQVQSAINEDELAYRFEQVVSLDVSRMVIPERRFSVVFQPIFQIARFFLVDTHNYVPIFRSFPPEVFPGILTAYGRLFQQAISAVETIFTKGGEQGLGLAYSEAVGALDRIGGFCFTGDQRLLMGSVLKELGTMAGLRRGGFPYIDPALLAFSPAATQGREASINLDKWPRRKQDGKPILMHITALAYHYGEASAANRQNELWFTQLGDAAFKSTFPIALDSADAIFYRAAAASQVT